jgi:hypothetical protein
VLKVASIKERLIMERQRGYEPHQSKEKEEEKELEECLTQVIMALPEEKQEKAIFDYESMYKKLGEETPIVFEDIPENPLNYEVEFNDDLMNKIDEATRVTREKKQEIGIVAIGVFDGKQKIHLVDSSGLIVGETKSIDFGNHYHEAYEELKKMQKYLTQEQENDFEGIVCLIHTHPPEISAFADNFSLGDLYQIKEANRRIQEFYANEIAQGKATKDGKGVATIGIVVTPKPDGGERLTTLMYDNESKVKGFYRLKESGNSPK